MGLLRLQDMGMGGQKEKVVCRSCGCTHEIDFTPSVDVSLHPELKQKVKSGEMFMWTCPECGCMNLAGLPFLYHDPGEKLMLILTNAQMRSEGLPEGYTGRIVHSVGELVEKINIFDSGLDDVVMELCKYVTCHELGKNVPLKFFKLGGADSEMTFTYPEDGQMQMVETGFKVYEDCAGIVNRNPEMKKAASGLVSVDRDWLSEFFA